jgi:hypothetical protein
MEIAAFRLQYLTEELARRNQDWQTRLIIGMTVAITLMTVVTIAPIVAPKWVEAAQCWLGW